MGLTVGKVVVDGSAVLNGVETYLTDVKCSNLYIVENDGSIDVICRDRISNFVDCNTTEIFDATTYSLILIVLEKMVLENIKFDISFDKTELMSIYSEREGEIEEAKLSINIL